MVPHTGAILTPTTAHQDHAVLLDVVALAGDVGCDHSTRAQAHTGRLALTRVGLLGPRDAHLEADALLLRRLRLGESWGHSVTGALAGSAFLYDRETSLVGETQGMRWPMHAGSGRGRMAFETDVWGHRTGGGRDVLEGPGSRSLVIGVLSKKIVVSRELKGRAWKRLSSVLWPASLPVQA
jgi:hypothetical protein